ncbi:MAG: hypothetical protein ACKN9P_07700 [Phenylobacterium sp.]
MGTGFLVLVVQVVGGIVGGCVVSNLLRLADTGPLGNAVFGALGGVAGAGLVAAMSPGLGGLPGLSGLLLAAILAGGFSATAGGFAVNVLRRRA